MTTPLPPNTVKFPIPHQENISCPSKSFSAIGLSVTRSDCGTMLILQSVDECGKPLGGKIQLPLDCDVIRDSCEELLSHIVDEKQLSQFSKNNNQIVHGDIQRRRERF